MENDINKILLFLYMQKKNTFKTSVAKNCVFLKNDNIFETCIAKGH